MPSSAPASDCAAGQGTPLPSKPHRRRPTTQRPRRVWIGHRGIPFDTTARLHEGRTPHRPCPAPTRPEIPTSTPTAPSRSPPRTTTTSDDAGAITRAQLGQACNIEGTVRSVQIASIDDHPVFACEATGAVTAPFYGRHHIAGITPGTIGLGRQRDIGATATSTAQYWRGGEAASGTAAGCVGPS